jgi:hypothetical protein
MAITVVGNQTVAGLSYIKIRAGVAVVDPVTSVAYVAPVAGVSYIELVASAQVDTSGQYQFVPETVAMSDGTSFSLAKALVDVASTQDTTRYEFEKSVGDSVELSEAVTRLLIFVRAYSDTTTAADTAALVAAKLLRDAPLVYDAQAKQLTKARSDTFALTDATAKQVAKAVADSANLADVARLSFLKAATDTTSPVEDVLLAISKLLTDAVGPADAAYRTVAKLLADGVGMNDSFDTGDGAVFSFSKGVSNVTIVGDATSKHPAKVVADSATTADSGSLVNQDYCDIDYFLDDYVGESRVF